MKKFLRIITFIILTTAILLGLYRVFSWKDTHASTFSSIHQLEHSPDQTIDIAFVGSSHVYMGITPAVLWGRSGVSSFDMAISGMDKYSSYYYTKHLLKTQSPKIVVVDLFGYSFEEHGVLSNEYRNMMSMPMSLEAIQLVRAYASDDLEKQKEYILRWPVVHTRYKELKKHDFVDSGAGLYGKGNGNALDEGGNADLSIVSNEIPEISETNKKVIDDFVALSQEEGFRLIFIVTPYSQNYEEQSTYNSIGNYLETLGIEYVNGNAYASEIGLDGNLDFFDPGHMNIAGAEKFTNWLVNTFQLEAGLDDHRGDPEYDTWQQDFDAYNRRKVVKQLEEYGKTANYPELVSNMMNTSDLLYIVSLDGAWQESTLEYNEFMIPLGLSKEMAPNGGTWICDEGKMCFVMDNSSTEDFYYRIDNGDVIRISKKYTETLENIKIGDESCQVAYKGMSFIVYDKQNGKIIAKLGMF